METQTVAGSVSSEQSHERRTRNGRYTIYKPSRTGKGGAVQLELNAQTPAVFVEGANQSQGEERRFDWESKIVMKWGLSDIAEVMAVLEQKLPEAKLFHQTDKGNTAFEVKYSNERQPATYFTSLSRQRTDTKEVDRVRVAVSMGEAEVILALLRHAALVLSGWFA